MTKATVKYDELTMPCIKNKEKLTKGTALFFGAHRGIQESKEEMTLQHEAVGKKIKPSQAFHFGLNKPLES